MMSESTSFPTETELGALLWPYAESPARGPADPNLLLGGRDKGHLSVQLPARAPFLQPEPSLLGTAATLGQWASSCRLSQAGPLFKGRG